MKNTMLAISVIFFLPLLWACKKENKEPDCRFSAITYVGSTTKLPVTYLPGDTIVRVGEDYPGYTLFFDKQKRLLRKEEPILNPYYRSELEYNSSGQVIALNLGASKLIFTYDKGKLTNIREENAASQSGHIYDHQLTWQGNDIQSVEHRLNQQPICKTQFSYEGSMPNPMRSFNFLYYADGDANYVYYKLPYYYSEHLLTRQESSCPLSETRLFTYAFTSNGLIESTSNRTGQVTSPIWGYEYDCR
ncbi:MAG: hypothetical protein JST68_30615 [Bacteroidetes bacterium]|nr:hypothetical protein [Bacteroidota bacterium]